MFTLEQQVRTGEVAMATRIIILEDDDSVADWMLPAIKGVCSDFQLEEPEVFSTELDFRNWLVKANASVPYIFILDIRVRWTFPSPEMLTDISEETDPTVAGIRCLQQIKEKFRAPKAILFSVLTEDELRQKKSIPYVANLLAETQTAFFSKVHGLAPLCAHLRALLK